MRYSIALFVLTLVVPNAALADDDVAPPPAHDAAASATAAAPSTASPPATPAPVTSAPATSRAVAPRPEPSHSAAPRGPAASDATEDTTGGYVIPHFVPYLGGHIPESAHIETKPNLGLVGSGAAIGGTAYFISLIYALSTCGAQMDCRSGSGWLYLPIVGPFITAAQSGTTGGAALAAFDGGVQVLGAVLAVAGVVAPRKFVVWQDKMASISVTPSSPGPMAAGLAVTLTHM
jgi:hypothetical protein